MSAGSPRPTFPGPAAIPFAQAARFVWGDDASGRVQDWIYVSSDKIHQLVFELPPGGGFRHSDEHRTIFAADELYYVLSGSLLLANPETGEVHRVRPGEAAFFRRDTWHHGFTEGPDPVRVLEYFSPPPSQGTSRAYARTKPNLTSPKYTQDRWIGRWPMAQAEAREVFSMRVVREQDWLWRLEGRETLTPVALLASSEHLTAGKVRLLPGQRTDLRVHEGDLCLYLLAGDLRIEAHVPGRPATWDIHPQDGFYAPSGTRHVFVNPSGRPCEFVFGIAPGER
jgi:quercetin dioxygenase-like cupin family protein